MEKHPEIGMEDQTCIYSVTMTVMLKTRSLFSVLQEKLGLIFFNLLLFLSGLKRLEDFCPVSRVWRANVKAFWKEFWKWSIIYLVKLILSAIHICVTFSVMVAQWPNVPCVMFLRARPIVKCPWLPIKWNVYLSLSLAPFLCFLSLGFCHTMVGGGRFFRLLDWMKTVNCSQVLGLQAWVAIPGWERDLKTEK